MSRHLPALRRRQGQPTQRPVVEGDEAFLRLLYADTRRDELASTGWSQAHVSAFLDSQFDLQHRHYSAVFGDEGHALVLFEGRPAGRLWLHQASDHDRLVDIALLATSRGLGLGTALIRKLQIGARKRGVPLRLSVLIWNEAARRLYGRLGFVEVGPGDGAHLEMEWRPVALR